MVEFVVELENKLNVDNIWWCITANDNEEVYSGWEIAQILEAQETSNLYKAVKNIGGENYKYDVYAFVWLRDELNIPTIKVIARLNEDGNSWSRKDMSE